MRGVITRTWHHTATLAAPFLRLMLRRRARRGKEDPARLNEREGLDQTPRPQGHLLWLHAASMGETQSILPVIEALLQNPALTVLVTTGTLTSATMLASQIPHLDPHRVLHRFVPLDVPTWAARFLDHWRPDAAGFVESELWPNLLAACQARRIPLMLVNARLSARSLRAWRRAPGFAHQVIGAFDTIHPQSEPDAARLRQLGARTLEPAGNLKQAAPPLPADPAALQTLQAALAARPVWLAASTHPGEEALVARVHHTLAPDHPGLVTIIAPRHPDRGPALAERLAAPRRGAGQGPPPGGIWLADTMGELGLLYRLAPIVFVGRSLVPPGGGQNPLEPARLGCTVAVGPYTANFAGPVSALREAGALTIVPDEPALAAWLAAKLATPPRHATQPIPNDPALPARIATRLLALASRP